VHLLSAPPHHRDQNNQEITTNPENTLLLQKINALESQFTHPKSKEIHDRKKAYVFITESKLAGNVNYNLNETKLESICNDDLEGEFINNQGNDYYVLDRDLGFLEKLNQEYQIDQRNDAKDIVFQNHISPTDYVVFKLEQGSNPLEHIGTFTIIDMNTKEIKKHTFVIKPDQTKEHVLTEKYKDYGTESLNAIKDLKLNNVDTISQQVIDEFKKITQEL
jgi:hypothetical protein